MDVTHSHQAPSPPLPRSSAGAHRPPQAFRNSNENVCHVAAQVSQLLRYCGTRAASKRRSCNSNRGVMDAVARRVGWGRMPSGIERSGAAC